MNPRKSCGPDNIEAKVIKLYPMIFADNLCLTYNKEIEIVKYPMAVQIAKVIALFKKGTRINQITIAPLIYYLASTNYLKEILYKRLNKFLEANKFLFVYQCGFRKPYFNTSALIQFTDSIIFLWRPISYEHIFLCDLRSVDHIRKSKDYSTVYECTKHFLNEKVITE